MRSLDNRGRGGTKYVRSRPGGIVELIFDRGENVDTYYVDADGTVIDRYSDRGKAPERYFDEIDFFAMYPTASRRAANVIGRSLGMLGLIVFAVPFVFGFFVMPFLPAHLTGEPLVTWVEVMCKAGFAVMMLGFVIALVFHRPLSKGTRLD